MVLNSCTENGLCTTDARINVSDSGGFLAFLSFPLFFFLEKCT